MSRPRSLHSYRTAGAQVILLHNKLKIHRPGPMEHYRHLVAGDLPAWAGRCREHTLNTCRDKRRIAMSMAHAKATRIHVVKIAFVSCNGGHLHRPNMACPISQLGQVSILPNLFQKKRQLSTIWPGPIHHTMLADREHSLISSPTMPGLGPGRLLITIIILSITTSLPNKGDLYLLTPIRLRKVKSIIITFRQTHSCP